MNSWEMEGVSFTERQEAIASIQSTIRKLEKALAQMRQKESHTTLVEKRLKALCISLAVLENLWERKPYAYTAQDLVEARDILMGLLPSIESSYTKSKEGSPQRTLLERRLKSLKLGIQGIGTLINV